MIGQRAPLEARTVLTVTKARVHLRPNEGRKREHPTARWCRRVVSALAFCVPRQPSRRDVDSLTSLLMEASQPHCGIELAINALKGPRDAIWFAPPCTGESSWQRLNIARRPDLIPKLLEDRSFPEGSLSPSRSLYGTQSKSRHRLIWNFHDIVVTGSIPVSKDSSDKMQSTLVSLTEVSMA